MKLRVFTYLTIVLLVLSACSSKQSLRYKITTTSSAKNPTIADTIFLSIKPTVENQSYSLYFDDEVLQAPYLIPSRTGEQTVKAIIETADGTKEVTKNIKVYAPNKTKVYGYELIKSYPHDINAYTQGLEFVNGTLFESTGQYGESKLRALDYKNNTVLKNIDLSSSYFGEGLTVLNDKIYQLTWKEGRGLIYDVNSFESLGNFKYGQSKEGWGLCNDGTQLYKTDGSENIWILNAETLEEERFVQAYTNKGRLTNLNELEWVEGKIYANRYQKNGVAIINPINGAIEAVIDFKALKNKVTAHPDLDVLNGMAYNSETKTLFVTGKRWDKLFEVRIIPSK